MWKSIQALRGVAALMVVAYHAGGLAGLALDRPPLMSPLQGGVDIFFVISGFVMVSATYGRDVTRWAFMKARLERIAPLFWLALSVMLIVRLAEHAGAPPVSEIVRAYLFIPYTDAANHQPVPFLSPGWTLSYELYFYALFALTLRLRPMLQIGVLTVVFGAAFVLGRHFVGADAAGHPVAYRITSALPFEFLGGMAIAHIARGRTFPQWLGWGLLAGSAVVWAQSFVHLPGALEHLRQACLQVRTIGFGVPALLLVAASVVLERWFRMAWAVPVALLGDASYSIYLSHPFLIVAMRPLASSAPAAVLLVGALCGAAALGLLCHFVIEKPLLKLVRVRMPFSKPQPPGA